uniref:Uncharacterized protein n=1 Tax=Amphimedon queenslandica TaxID=400682 RepID=A0A1X7SUZ7_AMPQE
MAERLFQRLCKGAFKRRDHEEAVGLLLRSQDPNVLIDNRVNEIVNIYDVLHSLHRVEPDLLYYSISNGWLDVTRDLITEYHFDPHGYYKSESCLYTAAKGNHVDIVEYLIKECGCNPMVGTSWYNSVPVLHYVASEGLLNVLKCMVMNINGHIMDKQYRDTNGRTVLHCAVKHIDVIKYLINDFNCDIMTPDKYGITVLHDVASKGSHDIIKYFINTHHYRGQISQDGNIDIVKYLICNCDIMVTDKDASEGLLDVL